MPGPRDIEDFGKLPIDPLTVRIPLAVQLTGLSRSRIYELIDTGEIETIKIGGSRLIPYDGLKEFIQKYRQPAT